MSANSRSDARLNFRLPSDLKNVIERAAGYLRQSVSEFAVSALVRSAHDVIERHDRTELSGRDREISNMLDDADAVPNAELAKADEKYKQAMD